jgi:magnesium chelatase subunit D
MDREQLDERIRERLAEDDGDQPGPENRGPDGGGPGRPPDSGPTEPPASESRPEAPLSAPPELRFDPGEPRAAPTLAAPGDRRRRSEGRGRRSRARTQSFVGHYVGAELPRERPRDLALDATLRAAAPHQQARRAAAGRAADRGAAGSAKPAETKGPSARTSPHASAGSTGSRRDRAPGSGSTAHLPALLLRAGDLREKVRETKTGNLIMFVVDASGSMAARERMVAAKGAVLALLLDAYQKRDLVGLVAFRGQAAELLLPPTSSVDLAERRLVELPTGGRTPLGHGVQLALSAIQRFGASGRSALPLLVLVSDGRANVSLRGGDPLLELQALGQELRRQRVHSVMVDAETSQVRFGFAVEVAEALGSSYLPLPALAAGSLVGAAYQGLDLAGRTWGRA